MEQEEANPDMYAICKDCGHKWKPRNPNAKNPKCSKCGSLEITYGTDSTQIISDDPTTEEIAAFINQRAETEETEEENPEVDNEEQEETETHTAKFGFKVHPVLLVMGLVILIGAGAAVFFRRRSKKQTSPTPVQEKRSTEEEAPTRASRPVIGHYISGV